MQRNKVLWRGSRAGRERSEEFERRGLDLQVVEGSRLLEADLRAARGVVFAFGESSVSDIRAAAEESARSAIDHGLMIFAVAEDDTLQGYARETMTALGVPEEAIKYRTGKPVEDHEIAQAMLLSNPQSACSTTLKIEQLGDQDPLSASDELLLRRAFYDCEQIRLTPLTGGRTADTFMVEATFAGSLVGPRPLPFFAKLGKREKIGCEVDRYRDYATHFIPFHLRPNLDPTRCVMAFDRAILVGNFVERAEPLWGAAKAGKAHAAIHSLFDVTLAGWRAQGFARPLVTQSVAGALGLEIFDYRRVQDEHRRCATGLGLKHSPQELWERLIGATSQCYYRAPMHGDLHPGNVFVRAGDAILIDLASVQQGPLCGDLACLETAFIFEHALEDDKYPPFEDWKTTVDQLYNAASFTRLPPPLTGSDEWAAVWNCARQVRTIALPTQACASEYLCAVAMYLLRRSMYPASSAPDGIRRSYALVVADRLLTSMKGS